MEKAGYSLLKGLVNTAIATASKEECIVWECKSKTTYPQLMVTDDDIGIKNKVTRINRAVAQYVLKRQLSQDEEVDHDCNNVKCINPYHLFVMSKIENLQKKHWKKISFDDRLIINSWIKEVKISNQTINQKRSSATQFLDFTNYSLHMLSITRNDKTNIILKKWEMHLSTKQLKESTIKSHLTYIRNLLCFIKKHNFNEILQREQEVYVEPLNVVEQAKEELSKEKPEAIFKSITSENELTALRIERDELRKEVARLKSENELLRSKLAKKYLEIAPPKLNYS